MKRQVAAIEKRLKSVPFSVGFRSGWAESSYDMPVGFFYGAFINDRLTALGAEWRYNEMANDGEQFQQYRGSLAFGWQSWFARRLARVHRDCQ